MDYRTLGRTGLRVPAVGFGGAPIGLANYLARYNPDDPADEATSVRAVVRALEAGITYLDTAASYGAGRSEQIIGMALRQAGALRRDARLATKTGKRTPAEIVESVEASLRHLGVDTIDVMQLHGGRWTDEEAARALEGGAVDALRDLQRQGKVRFLGFTAETGSPGVFRLLRSGAFDVLQIAYNVMYQDACNLMVRSGAILEAKERGMGVVTMRSLGSEVFYKLMTEHAPRVVAAAGEGEATEHRPAAPTGGPPDWRAFALVYVLSNPHVDCAIVGMRTAEEVERNAALAARLDLRLDLEALHVRYV